MAMPLSPVPKLVAHAAGGALKITCISEYFIGKENFSRKTS
jgi:hypothetical protein